MSSNGKSERVWDKKYRKWIEVVRLDPPDGGLRRKKRKPFKIDWVKLPNFWIERLERCRRLGTYKLALRILREAYKRQYTGGDVVLSAAATGLPQTTRRRAVKEMVELGLIRTKQDGNKAPTVMELLSKGHTLKRARRGRNGG